jgi:hypothetical protein
MRKIHLIILFAAVTLLAGCKLSIEKQAEKAMIKEMKETSLFPESVKISNLETVFLVDSICILHYDCKRKNRSDGYITNKMEYVYCLFKTEGNEIDTVYFHVNLDDKDEESVLDAAMLDFRKRMSNSGKDRSDFTKEKLDNIKIQCLKVKIFEKRLAIELYKMLNGTSSSDSKDLDKW